MLPRYKVVLSNCVPPSVLLLLVPNNLIQVFEIEHCNDLDVQKYCLKLSASIRFDKHKIWPKLS